MFEGGASLGAITAIGSALDDTSDIVDLVSTLVDHNLVTTFDTVEDEEPRIEMAGVIRELAIGASIGVAVIVFTNLILLPVAISYAGISKKAITRSKHGAVTDHPFWRLLSNFASPRVAPVSVILALIAFGGGLWYSQNLKIGRQRDVRSGERAGGRP